MECILPTKKYGDLTFYIDDEDEQILDNHVLYVSKIDDKFYIITKDRKYLHRIVMNAPKGMVVDHINHNTLDNRKSNLRIVTFSENSKNSLKSYTDMQKLSRKQVEEILLSDESNNKLAKKYNVSNCLISNIRTGKEYATYSPELMRRKKKWFTREIKLVKKYSDYKQSKGF